MLFERSCFIRLETQWAYTDLGNYLKTVKKAHSRTISDLDLKDSKSQATLLSFVKSFGIHSVVRSSTLKESTPFLFWKHY